VLLGQREVQADLTWQGPGAASGDSWHGKQLEFVHQTGRDCLLGELRAADGEVTVGRSHQTADLVRR